MEYSLSEIDKAAEWLLGNWDQYFIWCFVGDMGSGKTTLIKAICENRGVIDPMSSPTFSIVNEYSTNAGETIYHFDFYRLEHESEAENIGVEEYFYSGDHCLIEWPEKVATLIPDNYLEISIKLVGENQRALSILPHG